MRSSKPAAAYPARDVAMPLIRSCAVALAPLGLLAAIGVLLGQRRVASWDQSVSMWVQGPRETVLTVIGFFTDWLCSWEFTLAAAAAACAVLASRKRWLAAMSVALIFPLAGVEVVLKYLVHQPPASHYLQVRLLIQPLSPHVEALSNGFPSGHASRIGFALGWLALYFTPARHRLPLLSVTLAVALMVGWTRIYVGDHSVLEILAGLLLSAAFLIPAQTLLQLSRGTPPPGPVRTPSAGEGAAVSSGQSPQSLQTNRP